MNAAFLESLTSHPLILAIGWTLVHFVWQAALVAIIIAIVLGVLRQASARIRYLCSLAGLAVMTVLPIGTFVYFILISDHSAWRIQTQLANVEMPVPESRDVLPPSHGEIEYLVSPLIIPGWPPDQSTDALPTGDEFEKPEFSTAAIGWPSRFEVFMGAMQPWLPWLVALWIAGVFCLAIRMLVGLHRVGRWRREGKEIRSGALLESVSRLTKHLNIRRPVRILETVCVAVPVVIGWARPVILVPASMLTGLSPAELNSILAHELAHIRRYDYLVNLLQTVVETVLFYHPAVWWLSHRIRTERENCCDDIAIEVCGNRVVFARALAHMEEIRCRHEPFALAANGSSLIGRIRRIVGQEPVSAGPWWPAGAIVLGSLGMLLGGFWMTSASADPVPAEENPIVVVPDENPSEAPERPEDNYNLKKSEVRKIDPKTGIEKRLFADIKLESGGKNRQNSSVDMMYSNVMMYSFVPARIAKQLGATELGEIDFGAEAPPRERPAQMMFIPELHDPALIVEESKEETEKQRTIEAHDLMSPIEEGVRVVPYADDAIWIPGHLGFYGMNQTKQHVFKIVRIEKVDLGVGPVFGPVNALVLDDANSDFGVLGSNWVRKVRDGKGKLLWFDFTGTFHFMATPEHLKKIDPQLDEAADSPESAPGKITVESSGHDETPARLERDGVKVLATHTYPDNFRESTGWVEVNGAQVPVDVGVEHAGITVYKTLMFDIVAVDSKTEKTIWSIDWGKTMPMWKTVSIVELDRDGKTELAVELYAANQNTRELVYKYVSLATGAEVEPPAVSTPQDNQESAGHEDKSKELKFQIVDRDDDRTTRVAIGAFGHGRSATELVRHFSAIDQDISKFRGGVSTTNMESIVSAVNFNYVFVDRMDTSEVFFNLPEGSGLRAEFSGENVEINTGSESTTVVITNGRIEMIDAGGVIRAWASPDGGAEQLVIECREDLGEVVMAMTTRRIKPDAEYPNPPVQVVMNLETGAPTDEKDPPHRGVRYEIQQGEDDGKPFMRMKMKWRYDLKRLAEEATAESGLTLEELIFGKDDDLPQQSSAIPMPNIPPDVAKGGESSVDSAAAMEDNGWGMMAHDSGLRSRLTLQTERPVVGKPLLFKLEVRNFGEKPTAIDAQRYEPFRVLRAAGLDGQSAPFIGMTPQTGGQKQPLQPGASLTLWENVDAHELFLLEKGRYQFLAEGGEWAAQAWWRDSNTLEIEIADGQQTPLNEFLGLLLKDLPDDWQLANAMSPASGWKAVYLTHAPTGLKRDATGIQIWFTDEKLADDFELGSGDQKQIVTQPGKCQFGFINIAAQPKTPEIWPKYLEHVRKAATEALNFEEQDPSEPEHAAQAEKLPWVAVGHVTGTDGASIEGATVRAHCGVGSLRETGSAVTGKDGSYELHFGPGMRFEGNKGVQAATISVHLDGFTEINMHRQGDLVAAFEQPEDGNIGWGNKSEDDLFLPDLPKEIDFKMVPAVTVRGKVVDQNGNSLEGIRVSITGDELPPSSSVINEVRTNDRGEFEIDGIPPGYQFQIMVEPAKAEPPWLAWASAPVVFRYSESDTGLEYEVDGKPVDFTCQQLYLMLHGDGENWKTALKEAAKRKLNLSWDGASTDRTVRAGVAFLELGEKKE